MTVTFFGHRDVPDEVEPRLERLLIDLIEAKGATLFYMGHEGNFDRMARACVRRLQSRYPQVRYAVVLSYLPKGKEGNADTLYPEGLESVA